MLQGKTIFILSLMKFDGPTSTNFIIAKYLAKENDVYYIEHPLTVKDYLRLNKDSQEFRVRKEGLNLLSDGLLKTKIDGVNILVSLPIIPSHSIKSSTLHKAITWVNQRITLQRIKKIIRKNQIKDFIFINAYDFKLPDIGRYLRPRLSVYYCVDPIPSYDMVHGLPTERKLIQQSDIVICTSKALYLEKQKLNPRAYFVPNGADIVTQTTETPLERPLQLQNISAPVIGYVGAIERRIDFHLIDEVSQMLPQFRLVFVGPIHKEHIPDWFWSRPNLIHIEAIPYTEVPAMINAFDVCIIPFKKDEISRNIFPLKLFEYLGLGKAVVSTDFNPDLEEFCDGTVAFATDAASFARKIQECVQAYESDIVSKRLAVASKNTWSDRVYRISEILEKHL